MFVTVVLFKISSDKKLAKTDSLFAHIWKQTNRDLAIFSAYVVKDASNNGPVAKKKYFAKCQMRMDLFSILCASNSEDERVEKSNN